MKSVLSLVAVLFTLGLLNPVQAQTKGVAPKPAAKAPVKAAVPAAKKPAPATAAKPATPVAKPGVPSAKPGTATPKPAASAAPVAPVALVTDKMVVPAVNTSLLKVQASANPVTGRLTVRTNSPNPTRVEINGPDGRPVITRDLISSSETAVLDVRNLPPGAYIVQCTSGERRGIKRVMVGQ
ncbi:T9SS type A sorting domain-containing protein [Hymenobacter norwichensis]|uniref:T9SS type A sorting domain-containing protein n=1 Tax=Hymenobacter norwichensis TaxID=223903 RepID=UPI00146C0A4D|nr:T9SS type A sorting domain-containing protein [Hymenobacter norwichensis]